MLSVSGVSKEFGGLIAVDDINLEIGDGEIVGLIGPNGAGKTTLFNVITGVHDPDGDGTITFAGEDLTAMETHDIVRLGLVRTFQIVRVFEELTVLENVLAGAMFGTDESLSEEEARQRALDALSFVGLTERHGDVAGGLTIAQQKQLELARALAADPVLVMLDEIASGLTPSEIEKLSDTVRRLRDERGISVFWIEHVMEAIMDSADRIIVLDSGQKIAEGTPEEVRNDPRVINAYLGASDDPG